MGNCYSSAINCCIISIVFSSLSSFRFSTIYSYICIFLFRMYMCVCVLVCFTKQINSKTLSVCLQLYLRCVNVTNDTTKSYRHKSLMEVTKKRQHNNYQMQASQTFGRARSYPQQQWTHKHKFTFCTKISGNLEKPRCIWDFFVQSI